MQFDIDMIVKNTYSFIVEADSEDDALEKAYTEFDKIVDSGKQSEYFTDSDRHAELA